MLKKVLKFLLPVLALVIGLAAGAFFKPSHDHVEQAASEHHETGEAESETHDDDHTETHADHAAEHSADSDAHTDSDHHDSGAEGGAALFAFSHQFFVPLVQNGDDSGVIIMSIALETDEENLSKLSAQELRIRDIVLRQLFIAANAGRFDGNFTTEGRMRGLRKQILAVLQDAYGSKISAVLISDMARHEE